MINFSDFAQEIFQVLRSYGDDIVLYDDTGNRVYEPTHAARMYMTQRNILVSISRSGDNSSLRLYLSSSMNLAQYRGFIQTLRTLASRANLLFHVSKMEKQIKPQDFATRASVNEYKENTMNILEGMYGTSRSSYLKLENARMIVRHNAPLNPEVIGGRGRNIDQIFVENSQGERFLFPVNMMTGARAMAQHINCGGAFADDVGQQIIRIAQDFKSLNTVARTIQTNRMKLPESAQGIRNAVRESMVDLKSSLIRLSQTGTYVVESQNIVQTETLMEDEVDAQAQLNLLHDILGQSMDLSLLTSVARLIDVRIAAQSHDLMANGNMENSELLISAVNDAPACGELTNGSSSVSPDTQACRVAMESLNGWDQHSAKSLMKIKVVPNLIAQYRADPSIYSQNFYSALKSGNRGIYQPLLPFMGSAAMGMGYHDFDHYVSTQEEPFITDDSQGGEYSESATAAVSTAKSNAGAMPVSNDDEFSDLKIGDTVTYITQWQRHGTSKIAGKGKLRDLVTYTLADGIVCNPDQIRSVELPKIAVKSSPYVRGNPFSKVTESSHSVANALAAPVLEILKKLDCSVKTQFNKLGQMEIQITDMAVAGQHEDNMYVHTPKNISRAIDKLYREYRAAGHTFTQMVGGKFTIGESLNSNLIAPNNTVIQQFNSWMKEFDPEQIVAKVHVPPIVQSVKVCVDETVDSRQTIYSITKTKHSNGRTYVQQGTLAELIDGFQYTLETGASYSGERGNSKIDRNPLTIAALVKNLNKAINNSAANGYAGEDYALSKPMISDSQLKIAESLDCTPAIKIDSRETTAMMLQRFNDVLTDYRVQACEQTVGGQSVIVFAKDGKNIGEVIKDGSCENFAERVRGVLDAAYITCQVDVNDTGCFLLLTGEYFSENEMLVPQDQSKDFIDDIISKDQDNQPHDLTYLDRMRKLAGLN